MAYNPNSASPIQLIARSETKIAKASMMMPINGLRVIWFLEPAPTSDPHAIRAASFSGA